VIDRRTFLAGTGAVLLAAPLAAEAQTAGKVYRIGYLAYGTPTTSAGTRKAFTDGLRDHGWIEAKNIAIEYRWAGAGQATLDALAAELTRLPLDVIFAVNTPAALATKRTGTTLPVVFAQVSEPVAIDQEGTSPGSPPSIGSSCPSVWSFSRRRSRVSLEWATWPIPDTRFTNLNSPR
jgi:ABC-type uncharacterized transport system substrate-binding protein